MKSEISEIEYKVLSFSFDKTEFEIIIDENKIRIISNRKSVLISIYNQINSLLINNEDWYEIDGEAEFHWQCEGDNNIIIDWKFGRKFVEHSNFIKLNLSLFMNVYDNLSFSEKSEMRKDFIYNISEFIK
ncbi:hypothetical protein [Sphingopyxis sp. 550A]